MTAHLPPRPDLGHLKREAKNLLRSHQQGDAVVCPILRQLYRFNHASDADILASEVKLNEIQFAVALDYGFGSWNALKHHIERQQTTGQVNPHEVLCKTNWALIEGKRFSDREKDDTTACLLSSASSEDAAKRFGKSGNVSSGGRVMYPFFFCPPHNNGRKLITINGVMPKTHIFSANHYELEILRLLAIWRANDPTVQRMLLETRERLSRTCYGKFCSTGECFETSIVALRFLATAFPEDEDWIGRLAQGIRGEIDNRPRGKKRHSGTTFYYWLTLTDIDLPMAVSEIQRYEPLLVHHLSRSYSYSIDYDRTYNPIAKYIVRNCLARLPEYHHVRRIQGYVGSDGRFHLDFAKASPEVVADVH